MNALDKLKSKIIPDDRISMLAKKIRGNGKSIVFTNGCFDILHRGHIEYLARASELADIFILGLNSDQSVRRIKGSERPLQDEQSRSLILASIEYIDYIVLFDEDTPYELIKNILPDILVKGADYKPEDIVGYDIVTANGGKVMTVKYLEGYSTSGILRKSDDARGR